jgi:phosphoserine phosphatase RsbU/P
MEKYKKIIELMNKINSRMSFQLLIKTIVDSAKDILGTEGSSLLLVDPKTEELIFDVVISEKGEIIQGKRLQPGTGIAGQAAKTGNPILSNDVAKDGRFYDAIDRASGFTTRSALAVPVKTRETLIGVLEVVNTSNIGGFTIEDIEMLVYIADAAAIAIHNNELLVDLKCRVEELSCIYEISQSIYFSSDVEVLLARVIKEISRVMHAERCSFVILADDRFSVEHYISSLDEKFTPDLEGSLIAQVVRTGDPLLVYNLDDNQKFASRKKYGTYNSKSFVCIPMKIREHVIGVLSVTEKAEDDPFDSFDLQVLSTISQQVAETYDNVKNYNDELERRRLDHDLKIAAEIQRQSFSDFPEKIGSITLGGFIRPARYIGGDFFEVSESGSNLICASVGDISGKGIPAAMFLSTVRNALRHEMLKSVKPEKLLPSVNRLVYAESCNGMFCTFFYTVADREKKVIQYASAGHNPQYFYDASEDKFIELSAVGRPFGIIQESSYGTNLISYDKGDMLILFTDGLVDLGGYADFTLDQLFDHVRQNKDLSGKEIADSLNRKIEDRLEKKEPFDDSTFLMVKFD